MSYSYDILINYQDFSYHKSKHINYLFIKEINQYQIGGLTRDLYFQDSVLNYKDILIDLESRKKSYETIIEDYITQTNINISNFDELSSFETISDILNYIYTNSIDNIQKFITPQFISTMKSLSELYDFEMNYGDIHSTLLKYHNKVITIIHEDNYEIEFDEQTGKYILSIDENILNKYNESINKELLKDKFDEVLFI